MPDPPRSPSPPPPDAGALPARARAAALPLVYPLVAWGAARTVAACFRAVPLGGAHVPPPGEPALVAGTHCGMVMDPAVVITTTPRGRQNHYWAKKEVWNHPATAFIFDGLGAVPVFRAKMSASLGVPLPPSTSPTPDDDGDAGRERSRTRTATGGSTASQSGGSNELLWRATREMLAKGHLMVIFPEGTSYTLPHLIEFKDGLARAALDYATYARSSSVAKPAPIIPVGVTYLDKTRWRSQVVVSYGAPIPVEPFLDRPPQDLTRHVLARVKELTLNAPDWDVMHAARLAHTLLESHLFSHRSFMGDVHDPPAAVPILQGLIALFSDTAAHATAAPLMAALSAYAAMLERRGLVDAAVEFHATLTGPNGASMPRSGPMSALPDPALLRAALPTLFIKGPLVLPGLALYSPVFALVFASNRTELYREVLPQNKGFATLLLVPLTLFVVFLTGWIAGGWSLWTGAKWFALGVLATEVGRENVDEAREAMAQIEQWVRWSAISEADKSDLIADRTALVSQLISVLTSPTLLSDLEAEYPSLAYGPFKAERSTPPDHLRPKGKFPEPTHIAFEKRPWADVRRELERVVHWVAEGTVRAKWVRETAW